VVVLAGVALGAALLVGTVQLGSAARDRARLAAAADLTALAAVTGGRDAAVAVAAGNGVILASLATTGDRTVVTVAGRGGAARASAKPSEAQRGRGGPRG
jgi:hypothetical protein